MGFFSWKTQDTNRSISNRHSDVGTFKVVMHDNAGNTWVEKDYDGYGVFGGKDYYQLLAEMNGYTHREDGIRISYNKTMYHPNLTENIHWTWVDRASMSCPNQGYFYL